ncbi:ABC transporter substrate-binding protein [Vibrio methylphosphonaticus]|uniref:ABC transporter substrate-binding protein n=1 Tax=Vibrio methylphosphonaticus TaxID=2946866 RepID=UPI00202A0002|nr:ABC transporter substrate-binding protein [Vibrio methylphosphonaticus]MCL9774011.1 ABC transporter substrate-binding protein [Vibrio methylphosphonaticus]
MSHLALKRETNLRKLSLAVISLAVISSTIYLLSEEDNHVRPTQGNTISVASSFEFTTQNPAQHGYIYTRMGVLETLLNVDEAGQLQPGLATDWVISEDGLHWTFTIRQNVKFHDGQVLTAKSAVQALENILKNHGPLTEAPVSEVVAIDDQKFEILLTRPFSPLGAVLANYTTGIASPDSYNEDGFVEKLAATGPYQVFDFEPPHKLVVERFEEYWGNNAKIKFASYLTGHRSESRVLQSKSGQADIVFGLEPSSIPLLRDAKNVTLYSDPIPRTIAIKLNAGHKYLEDVRVRQALILL